MQDLGGSVHVLGTVLTITVDIDALVDGLPQIDRLKPVSRLCANEWGLTPTVYAVDRPTVPEALA